MFARLKYTRRLFAALTYIGALTYGQSEEDFDRYDRAIRLEYARVPDIIYRRERATVLRGLLEREPLYATPYFREHFERPARANLRRALARLGDA